MISKKHAKFVQMTYEWHMREYSFPLETIGRDIQTKELVPFWQLQNLQPAIFTFNYSGWNRMTNEINMQKKTFLNFRLEIICMEKVHQKRIRNVSGKKERKSILYGYKVDFPKGSLLGKLPQYITIWSTL